MSMLVNRPFSVQPHLVFGASDHDGNETDLSSYSFSGMSFGDEGETRQIVVLAFGGRKTYAAVEPSGCSVGGVTATLIGYATNGQYIVAAYIADVPTGATGTVVMDWGYTMNRCAIATVPLYGLASAVPVDEASDTTNTYTASIAVPAGGVLLGGVHDNTGTVPVITWSGSGDVVQLAYDPTGATSTAGGGEFWASRVADISCDISTTHDGVGYFFSLGPDL